jgi:glycosyltransferase involved in cell wall biosynthesis
LHEIIVHVNEGSDGTYDYVKKNSIKHSYSSKNIGLCSAVNNAAALSTSNYIMYTHDDMFFCKNWDVFLKKKVEDQKSNFFYLSGKTIYLIPAIDGFKKWFSINAPNLVIMVFIFGLIHGFGLSTKLQEVAVASGINLSLSQILSFNVGVEFGQIAVLIIVFPLLSMIRGRLFDRVSKFSNWLLIVAGIFLLVYQLNGYFTNHTHHPKSITTSESKKEQIIKLADNENNHNYDYEHSDSH